MSGENSEILPKFGEDVQLGTFLFSTQSLELKDKFGKIQHLRHQSAQVLARLAHSPGEVVSKSDLIETVWPDTFVTEDSLGQCIADIRRVLNDKEHRIVQTFPKKGYLLAATSAVVSRRDDGEINAGWTTGPSNPRLRYVTMAVALLILVLTGWLTGFWQNADPSGSNPAKSPDPSILVLPFENQTGATELDYLAAGFSTSIRTQLARFPQLFVIAGSTAVKFKTGPGTARGIGRELGVRYILDGSLRKVGDVFVVTTELVETESEKSVWAQEFDFRSSDTLSIQTELVQEIVSTLNVVIGDEELAAVRQRETGDPNAYDLFIRAEAASQQVTPEGRTMAVELLNQALALDPDYLAAHFELSGRYLSLWRFGGASDPQEALRLARHHAERALAISQSDYRGHFRMGMLYLFADHNHELAHAAFQRAVQDNPNDADVLYNMGFLRSLMGYHAEALDWNNRAKRINPRYPGWYNFNAALSHYFLKDYAEAEKLARLGMTAYPTSLAPRRILIATLVEAGRMDEARAEVAAYLAIRPDFRLSTFHNTPFQKQTDQDRYYDAMRQAGIPD